MLAVTMALSSTAVAASADVTAPEQAAGSGIEIDKTGAVYNSKFGYIVNADGKTITIIEFTNKAISGNTLVIPSKIGNKKVTGLADLHPSFIDNYGKVKTIDIPKTVKEINNWLIPADSEWYVDGKQVKAPNITIKCSKKSAAEKFAALRNMKYTLKDASKNYVKAVRIKKTVGVGKTWAKFKWEKSSNATGYRVFKFDTETNKLKKLADVKVPEFKYTKCDPGCNNYFVVRAFRKSGGKTYWSVNSTMKAIQCRSLAKPKVDKAYSSKVEYDDGSDVYRLILAFRNRGEQRLSIEVLDPYSKIWGEPETYYLSDYAYEDGLARIDLSSYAVNKYGRYYWESIDKGQTYKVRIKSSTNIGDSTTYTDDWGIDTFSYHEQYGKAVTKTIKVK